jgi:hypothetical protein
MLSSHHTAHPQILSGCITDADLADINISPAGRAAIAEFSTAPLTLRWGFNAAESEGSISSCPGVASSPLLRGSITQTGGGPCELWGDAFVLLTRFFGQHHPILHFSCDATAELLSIEFRHEHNHNPGFPTFPSYAVRLQLDTGVGFADIGDEVALVGSIGGGCHSATDRVALGAARLAPGSYSLRWDPRGLHGHPDTQSEFFGLHSVELTLRPCA